MGSLRRAKCKLSSNWFEHALERCRRRGEQWLLHVDSDELLWLPDALPN